MRRPADHIMVANVTSPHYEADVLPGLEPFAAEELRTRFGSQIDVQQVRAGGVPFEYRGDPTDLSHLRTVGAVYRVVTAPVPRPKALLGHQHMSAVMREAQAIAARPEGFETLSLDAAGSDTAVMQRIKAELASGLSLRPADDKGDFHVRIRPSPRKDGWQTLLRLTPRPLATRSWRLHNLQGALNAPVASVMAGLTRPAADDSVLNIACGSATLMVERALLAPYRRIHGIDVDPGALDLAREHLAAAGHTDANLLCADVARLPYAAQSFNALLADLPFGQLVGSHQNNLQLYPAALREAARVAVPGALFALITHEKRLIADVLRAQTAWSILKRVAINLNGLHPEILLLQRNT